MIQALRSPARPIFPALMAFAMWALAAFAGVYWAMRWQGQISPPANVPTALTAPSNASALTLEKSMVAQALGAPAPTASGAAASPAQTSHQWVLFGVVAGTSGRGSALIGMDGQVPRAFKLGQTVLPGWVLHSVERRLARLAPSMQETPSVTLQLPAQPE